MCIRDRCRRFNVKPPHQGKTVVDRSERQRVDVFQEHILPAVMSSKRPEELAWAQARAEPVKYTEPPTAFASRKDLISGGAVRVDEETGSEGESGEEAGAKKGGVEAKGAKVEDRPPMSMFKEIFGDDED
eukprot:TRINITY_DN7146_c0_g1_i4.p2 TRINITY_DN7146_c0_g1~~TRINITY_DN7146_c0_g1_i4.p2  ORF type:complete len:130 (-),score=33.31 TRINITY_DN7146_c0_g1_i4:206-595(-)